MTDLAIIIVPGRCLCLLLAALQLTFEVCHA
jgi:hypothetical protein